MASPRIPGRRNCVPALFILGFMYFGYPGRDSARAPADPGSLMKFQGFARLRVFVVLATLLVAGRPLLERRHERCRCCCADSQA